MLTACGGGASPPPDRVLLVTIDTLRADRLGSYGAGDAHTPQLDALAARGVRFDAAISPAPITLPAHASLLTGLDPPHHGVRHNGVHRLDDDLPTLGEAMRSAGYATAAFIGARVLDHRYGLARGFDHYDDRADTPSGAVVGWAERRAGAVVDAALAWLASAPPRWFVWVHVYDPHADYAPPPGFAAASAGRPYDGEIAYVDYSLGRLFAVVAAEDAPGRALVAVTSDHGESLGEHSEPTHSYTVYDATQRVPLILAGAGLPQRRVVAATVRLVDVAPTLLALAGAAPLAGIDGASLLPLVDGSERAPRVAYVESLATHLDHGWSPLVGLRTERWKYVRAPRPELYDLRSDSGETRDRAATEPDRVRALDALLRERLVRERDAEPAPALDPEHRAQLQALGYAAGGARASSRERGPDPKDEIAVLHRIARAEELADRGDAGAALALLGEIAPAGPALLALRAALAVRAGHPDAAERDARALLAREPGREDAWLLLGQALEAQGRSDERRSNRKRRRRAQRGKPSGAQRGGAERRSSRMAERRSNGSAEPSRTK